MMDFKVEWKFKKINNNKLRVRFHKSPRLRYI